MKLDGGRLTTGEPGEPVVEIIDSEFGLHPEILPLNPSFRPGASTLKLMLHIRWDPPDSTPALLSLEEQLLAVCPSLARHECRGPSEYHVRRFTRTHPAGAASLSTRVEAGLALAHLVEHVMIDAVAYVTRSPQISGITGALARVPATYDVFVECPHTDMAALAAYVGPEWTMRLLEGASLDGRSLLDVARALYDARPDARVAAELGCELKRPPAVVAASLAELERAGFACRDAFETGRDGPDRYRLC